MYWLADEFLVQWRELAEVYGPRAHYKGSLIDEMGELSSSISREENPS